MAFASSVVSLKKYDVFLNFRGEDTRSNFTSHLHDALSRMKVETFIDNELEKGDEISPALIKAIEESHASILIFSENYASSKWCLDELIKILECKKDEGQIAIPVFYNIDPSHVRKQTESYEKAFAKHKKNLKLNKDKLQKWKAALTEAANLTGWDSRTYRNESEFIQDIVKDVLQKVKSRYPYQLKGLVGIEKNYVSIERSLEIGTSEVRMIGIWGMGGIGKTALATALYAKLSTQFEGHCFLENVREQSDKKGLNVLHNELLSELLEEECPSLHTPKVETSYLMSRLGRKQVFIVLDDVATSKQLEALIDKDCLGPGSRVIVTTRDKHIFSQVDEIYEVHSLDFDDSLHLFCLHAFRQKHPEIGFEGLSESVVKYCKGVPLSLEVLGAHLRSKRKAAWEDELRKLQKFSNVEIHKKLKLSYDDLDYTQKDIFLDIACFFKGWSRERVTSLLEACDFFPESGIETLIDKALITISRYQTIEMHDLIQEMGQEIVNQECIKDPGKRSRLWKSEQVFDVLKNNKGTEAVEGIIFNVSDFEKVLQLGSNSFEKMTNLRYLIIYYGKIHEPKVYLPNNLEFFSDKLRYLRWDRFCLESLPSTFPAEMLVEFSMRHSNLKKLWDGVQNLVNLKKIDLSDSRHLVEVPDLSRATNLEKVGLAYCFHLRKLHPSILSLPKLTHLDLTDCEEIESHEINVQSKSLRSLQLVCCLSVKEFSVISMEMVRLNASWTAIRELPPSIWHNSKLTHLDLRGCEKLNITGNKLANHPRLWSLTKLNLSGCTQISALDLQFIFDVMPRLQSVDLSNCSNIRALPDNTKNLSRLIFLWLDDCRNLVSLPELPSSLEELTALNCTSLEGDFTHRLLNEHMFQNLPEKGRIIKSALFPGAQVPDLFSFRTSEASITISHHPKLHLRGFIFCLILSDGIFNSLSEIIVNIISENGQVVVDKRYPPLSKSLISNVMCWYSNINRFSELERSAFDQCKLSFEFKLKFSTVGIKGCGVFPVKEELLTRRKRRGRVNLTEKSFCDHCFIGNKYVFY